MHDYDKDLEIMIEEWRKNQQDHTLPEVKLSEKTLQAKKYVEFIKAREKENTEKLKNERLQRMQHTKVKNEK